MIVRLRMLVIVILIAIDQLAAVLLLGPFYLAGRTRRPSPDETISSIVGWHALQGKRWARAFEWLIDGLFYLVSLGRIRGHCRASIEWDER